MSSSSEYEAKAGDTPTIRELLKDRNGAAIAVPVGSTVTFLLEKVAPSPEAETSSSGTLNDAATGDIEYTLTTAQTAMSAEQTEPDVYEWEFRVTNTGYQLTAPSSGRGRLVVNPALDT